MAKDDDKEEVEETVNITPSREEDIATPTLKKTLTKKAKRRALCYEISDEQKEFIDRKVFNQKDFLIYLKEIFIYTDSTKLYLLYLYAISDKISIYPIFKNRAEMISNLEDIYNIIEEKDSLRATQIHPITRNYFIITLEIKKYFKKVLIFSRF